MKILSSFFIIILSVPCLGYICQFRQYSGDIQVSDIHGKQIYTFFTDHLRDQEKEVAAAISSGDVLRQFNQLIENEKHKDTIKSKQSDVRQLRQLLTSNQINWIGLETSRENMDRGLAYDEQVQDYSNTRDVFNELKDHPQWSEEKTDQILHLIYPADIIARAKYPKLFEGKTIVPLENDRFILTGKELIERILKIQTDLHNSNKLTPQQLLAIEHFGVNALNQRRSTQNTHTDPITLTELEDFLEEQSIEDPEITGQVRSYINAINYFIRNSSAQNRFTVRVVENQNSHGIILMGSTHQAEIERRLVETCSNTSQSPSSQSKQNNSKNKGTR